jgi:oligopeptide/dipeptide ABC transporter ATP-binding protein
MEPILRIEDLRVSYNSYRGVVHAVGGIDMDVNPQETFGIVGETGCGKSTVGLSVVRLIPSPGKIDGGKILLDNDDLVSMDKNQMREIRRTKLALIFQDPSTSLNPVLRIGLQLSEALRVKRNLTKKQAAEETTKMLADVGIANPQVARLFPHELSGGMKQRVMIAMALTGNPELLIADEPTSSLDVTLQAQIMELLAQLTEKNRLSVLLITHSIGLVSQYCEKMAVMYAGRIVETGDTANVMKSPAHPYTKGLLASAELKGRNELIFIPGSVPDLINVPQGCPFAPRCSSAMAVCTQVNPELIQIGPTQEVACHLYAKGS